MKIRVLAAAEWELKRDLRLAALKDSPKAFSSTHDREARYIEADWRAWPRNGVFFAAFGDDDTAAGIAAGYREPALPHVVRLISMWVAPWARRQGVAGALTAAVIAWAREQKATLVELEIASGNEAARQAYLQSGFIVTDRTPSSSCGAVLEFGLKNNQARKDKASS